MKFSILVLTYFPSWRDIRLTLESILEQDMDDYEIVVSDDGSDNNRFDQIQAFFEENNFSNYQLLPHPENQGTVKNILDAAEHAKGTYIRSFGQGDLFYSTDTLRNLYNFMEKNESYGCFGLLRGFSLNENKELVLRDFCHPFDINAYRRKDKNAICRNLILYRDNASGAATCFRRDFYIEYLHRIAGQVKYTEDILQLMAGADGKTLDFYPDFIAWYEMAVGVSTKKKSKFAESLARDVDEFYKLLYREYPNNKYVLKQKKVGGLYRIRNLYMRTIIRCFVNPDAVRYLISHWIQMKKGAYLPEHNNKGFLDSEKFRKML